MQHSVPRRGYHHGELKSALVRHALSIADGSGEVSLREVARRAGVSHAAPYRHFRDLDALLAAAGEQVAVEIAERLEAAEDDDAAGLIGVVVQYAEQRAGRFRLFVGASLPPGASERAIAAFERALGAAPPERARMAWGYALGVGLLSIRGELGATSEELIASGAVLLAR